MPPGGPYPRMRVVFNAYLISFALEALLALASPWVGDGLHALAGFAATLLSLVVLLLIGSFRGLPWRPLAPALFLSVWQGCFYLPLPALSLGTRSLLLLFAGVHLMVGVATLLYLRRASAGKSFLFQGAQWLGCKFSWARTAWAFALKLLILLPCFVLYLVWSAQWMITKISHGFIQINASGLYTEARDYEKDGRIIHLLPTVHIAAPAFYDTLMESLPVSQLVVLPEGVTDKKNLLKARLDYTSAADSVGLSTQPDLVRKSKQPATQECDADLGDFSPATVNLLNAAAGLLNSASSGDPLKVLESLSGLEDKDAATIIEDVIETRNRKVIEGVRKVVENYAHIAIPWGAAHMPGIEREILKMNFHQTEARRVQVFGWKDLKFPTER